MSFIERTATGTLSTNSTKQEINLLESVTAHNYNPLPVVISSAEGAWVVDVQGNRYLDCLAGYSALNFGHRHPALLAAAQQQLSRLTLTSRAFHNDQLGPFCLDLSRLAGMDTVLPMNTGAEAIETAIKIARKWGYQVKGIPTDQAKIIVAGNNFHGRTITIVSFSTDADARESYGPYTPGFEIVPFGDASALHDAIDENTAAVLIEPIQGEAGIILPPEGYLTAVRELCTQNNVLFMADEIQSGLGRTGKTFAVEHWGVRPDVFILGKALGGGIIPVSAVLSSYEVMDVVRPGTHGSTFGGNPLAAAVGHAVVGLLETGEYQERAATLGSHLTERLRPLIGSGITAVRSSGLWVGLDIDTELMTARQMCELLLERGILAKDAHGATVRLAPPLVVEASELDWMVDQLTSALKQGGLFDVERSRL